MSFWDEFLKMGRLQGSLRFRLSSFFLFKQSKGLQAQHCAPLALPKLIAAPTPPSFTLLKPQPSPQNRCLGYRPPCAWEPDREWRWLRSLGQKSPWSHVPSKQPAGWNRKTDAKPIASPLKIVAHPIRPRPHRSRGPPSHLQIADVQTSPVEADMMGSAGVSATGRRVLNRQPNDSMPPKSHSAVPSPQLRYLQAECVWFRCCHLELAAFLG